MTQTGEARNNGNMIWTDIEPLVDMGSLDLLSNTLDVPLYLTSHSMAIYSLQGKFNMSIFILHQKGHISPIQEAQMTTVTDSNVHNIAIKETFDDCQVCKIHISVSVTTLICVD